MQQPSIFSLPALTLKLVALVTFSLLACRWEQSECKGGRRG